MAQEVIKYKFVSDGLKSLISDLGELKKAFDESKNSNERMLAVFDFTKKAVVGISAVTTAIAAMNIQMSQTIRDMDNLAKISGVNINQFRAYANAGKSVGLEMDKLADLFKDLDERVTEFNITGAGGFKDFTDTLMISEEEAKKLGEEISKLSAPDALMRITEEMEKAGIATQEWDWALEGLGGDFTYLVPLLEKGSKGLKDLVNESLRYQRVITPEEVEDAREISETWETTKDAVAGAGQSLLMEFQPYLKKALEVTRDIFAYFNESSVAGLDMKIEKLEKKLSDINEKRNRSKGEDIFFSFWGQDPREFDRQAEEIGKQIDELKSKREELVSIQNKEVTREETKSKKKSEFEIKLEKEETKKKESQNRMLESLRQYTATEAEILNEQFNKRMADNQALLDQGVIDEATYYEIKRELAQKFKEESEAELKTSLEKIREQLLSKEEILKEAYDKDLAILNESYSKKLISEEKYLKQKDALQKKYDKDYAAAKKKTREIENQGMNETISLTEDFFATSKDLYDQGTAEYKAMASAEALMSTYLAANKALAELPPPFNILMAGTITGLGLKNVAKINAPRNQGGQALLGGSYLVGEEGPEVFVPSQSGTIVPNSKISGGGGKSLVVNINNYAPETEATYTESEGGVSIDIVRKEAKATVVQEMANKNSQSNRSIQRNYGLKTRGV